MQIMAKTNRVVGGVYASVAKSTEGLTTRMPVPKYLAKSTSTIAAAPNASDRTLVTMVACLSDRLGFHGFTNSCMMTAAFEFSVELTVLNTNNGIEISFTFQ